MTESSKRLFLQLYSEIGTKISALERELLECESKHLEASHGSQIQQNNEKTPKDKRLHKMRKARKAKIERLMARVSDICK